jgi:nitrite reductase/ring-hydroxylating ferredoxin subunit
MLGRYLARLVDAQGRWAKPFGDFNHRWLSALFHPIRPIQNFLNGTWLGHPVHAVVTDVPIGAMTVSIIADVIGQPLVADVAMVLGVLAMVAAAVTGLADYTEVDGNARTRATVHGSIMVVSLLVYLIGTHVNRHAWRGTGVKWIKLDLGNLTDIPEGGPTRLKAGINELAVIRQGDRILAVHAQCAHAGGPLAEGTLVGDAIQCPWHGSRFRLADGHVVRGPAMYDQPAYEVRRAEAGGWEVRRQPA